jgi:hypothetical protein
LILRNGTTYSQLDAHRKEISRAHRGRLVDVLATRDRGFCRDRFDPACRPDGLPFLSRGRSGRGPGRPLAARGFCLAHSRSCQGEIFLIVDAGLDSGVTEDLVLRQAEKAAALDPPGGASGQAGKHRGDLEPDYFGFWTASNQVGVGYGLAGPHWNRRDLKELPSGTNLAARKSGKGWKKKA